jgi:hypothetical protein
MSKYAKIARDITELLDLEGGNAILNEFLFAMLASRLADLCEDDKPTISGDRFYRFVERNSE